MAVIKYHSIADIARQLDVPRHRVVYVVAAYRIPARVCVGELAGYTDDALALIKEHISRINSERLERI